VILRNSANPVAIASSGLLVQWNSEAASPEFVALHFLDGRAVLGREGGDCDCHILSRHPCEGGDPVLRSLSVGLESCNWRGPMLDRKTGVYWVPAFAGMTAERMLRLGHVTTAFSFSCPFIQKRRPQAGLKAQ
jgi:hypothetical protein